MSKTGHLENRASLNFVRVGIPGAYLSRPDRDTRQTEPQANPQFPQFPQFLVFVKGFLIRVTMQSVSENSLLLAVAKLFVPVQDDVDGYG
jgi:hypothetical protein